MITAKVIILTFLALLTISCISQKDQTVALTAIEQYHARFNDSKFDEIYDDSTTEHKNAISKERFLESIRAMRQGQGRVLSSEQLAVDYRSSPDAVHIKLLMLVTFEKGEANEEFIYRISDGKALLERYKFIAG